MKLDRRGFLKTVGVGAAVLSVGSLAPFAASCAPKKSATNPEWSGDDDQPIIKIGDDIAIAQTDKGKVKGFILRDVYTFLGIPYAANASGKNRFMPPQASEAWENVRPAVFYGNSAPQNIYPRTPISYGAFVDHWNYDEISEDCLTINVWTSAIADGKKRPVMVWLHGGGYTAGNGIEQDGYNGENISRYGDIVYCSINHRLGAIGFSDLSAVGGEKYKDSGNVGALDIIAALQWVNKNIANFGGDPANVTIAGQSGGGGKVCFVAAMPAAKGLVHKGIALSGSSTQAIKKEYSQKLGEYIVKEAGLTAATIDKLQDIPWAEYMKIAYAANAKMTKELGGSGNQRGGFGPIADGVNLPVGTFFETADENSPNIPMLFCTTFHEWNPTRTDGSKENYSIEDVIKELTPRFGDKTEAAVKAYAGCFPEMKPVEIMILMSSTRQGVVNAANTKLSQPSPVYMSWFGWCPPLFDNRMRAFHCLDISFWFRNTDLMYTHTGGGSRPRNLAHKMSSAMVSFMRTGDPNVQELPVWPKYTAEIGELMVFNDVCEVRNDPDRAGREALL